VCTVVVWKRPTVAVAMGRSGLCFAARAHLRPTEGAEKSGACHVSGSFSWSLNAEESP
jgi:hypothetical protein